LRAVAHVAIICHMQFRLSGLRPIAIFLPVFFAAILLHPATLVGLANKIRTRLQTESWLGEVQRPDTQVAELDSDHRLKWTPATKLRIMDSRYENLASTMLGYERSRVALVAWDGSTFSPAEWGDDAGIYYFVPRLCRILKISLNDGIYDFLFFVVAASTLVAAVGFALLIGSTMGLVAALGGLLALEFAMLVIGDVYVIAPSLAVAMAPYLLYLHRRSAADLFVLACGVAGLLAGVGNFIRAQSGTAVLIFALFLAIFGVNVPKRTKITAVLAIMAGLALTAHWSRTLVQNRNAFLRMMHVEYASATGRHGFWHPLYLGLGFVRNNYVPDYRDYVAEEKVHSISPNTECCSPEYERILRSEVFSLARAHPFLLCVEIAAKTGIVAMFLLTAGNIGLLAAFQFPKTLAVELAFWSALVFSALPGVFFIPHPQYLTGLFAFAVLYEIVSIDHAAVCWRPENSAKLSQSVTGPLVRQYTGRS
jgi:hypothetical protein